MGGEKIMSHFRACRNRRAAVLLMLIFIVITVTFVFAVFINAPDRKRADSALSEMEATETMDALLATVDKNKLGDDVIAEAQANGMVWVSVGLIAPPIPYSAETKDEYESEMADIQDQVLASIVNHNYEITDRFATAGFGMKADLATLIVLQSHPFVTRITLGQGQTGDVSFDSPQQGMEATQTMDALLATVDKDKLGDEVIAEAQRIGEIWVSVKLTDPKDVSFSIETLDEWARSISTIQAQVLQDIEGYNFRDVELLSHVSGMSLKGDLETLIALQSNPLVHKIQIAGEGTQGVTGPT